LLRIKELREDNDKKQAEIAELLGIQQNSYSQIENEKNTIQIDHLIKLASFYGTSTDYLLGLTDEIKPYPKSKTYK
jgi:transcriptional regulator with XRE-family HTH domain